MPRPWARASRGQAATPPRAASAARMRRRSVGSTCKLVDYDFMFSPSIAVTGNQTKGRGRHGAQGRHAHDPVARLEMALALELRPAKGDPRRLRDAGRGPLRLPGFRQAQGNFLAIGTDGPPVAQAGIDRRLARVTQAEGQAAGGGVGLDDL